MDKKWLKILFALSSGLLLTVAEKPLELPWLCFVAYIPLLFVLDRCRSFWSFLFYSWLAMFAQILVGFQWVHYVAMEFGLLSWWQAFFILIGFALFTNLSLQIFALLYWASGKLLKWKKSLFFYIFITPSLFVLSEILDPKIFNWYTGYLIADYKYLYQFVSVFGLSGMTFVIVLVNVLLYLAIKPSNLRYYLLLGAGALLFVLSIFGYHEYNRVVNFQSTCPKINVAVVQANIGNSVKLEIGQALKLKKDLGVEEYKSDSVLILEKYQRMSEEVLSKNPNVDVLIWPETAFPGYYIESNPLARQNNEWQKKIKVPLLIGVYYIDANTSNYYNSAALVDGYRFDIYHKKILLPFGEYMPLSKIFPFLKTLVPTISDFSRGEGAKTLNLILKGMEVKFAPTICYEMLKTAYVRKMIYKDTNILLNLTNDSWFGTIEPYQHLKIGRAKAVEFRRPIVRSTNTGVTAFIDMTGSVISSGGIHNEDTFVFRVPVCDHRVRSIYAGFGYLFPYALLITLITYFFISRGRKQK